MASDRRWIRLDMSWDDSSWIAVLSAGSQLAWIKLLCHVKRESVRGGSVKALDTGVAARKWGVGSEDVEKMLRAAVDHGAVSVEDGKWTVTKWNDYQSADSTERVRRFREKGEEDVTDVTLQGVTPRYPCHATVTETETENICAPSKRFKPPTLQEVRDRFSQIGVPVSEAERFMAYHESKGWVVGRAPMKSWTAACTTWKGNLKQFGGQPPPATKTLTQADIAEVHR